MSFAAPIWANRVDEFPTGPDVTHLRAVGQQFLWNFQYTGADGQFGRHDIKLVSTSNQLGLDRSDPAAADDLTAINEMHLPVNKPCIVDVMSKDVIHDFCIPNMRVAQDAMPGSIIPLWFIPVKTGTYEIVCAQLCGNNHSLMKATLVVDTEADYKKWFDETAKLSGATVVEGQPVAPADSSASSVVVNH
jgi:cytochrome c oxidase subunit 2